VNRQSQLTERHSNIGGPVPISGDSDPGGEIVVRSAGSISCMNRKRRRRKKGIIMEVASDPPDFFKIAEDFGIGRLSAFISFRPVHNKWPSNAVD
jgi:hypothetical protein